MDKENKKATRQSYGEALEALGEENKNVVVLDADLAGSTKTSMFGKKFPERFFDMGIAEQDMLGTAAGLATCGKIPYASTFAVFAAGRAYDQIRNSICYPNLNVKICATHAGITVGEDGATHQMLEDLTLMRVLPNMHVFCPSDDTETKWVINEVSKIDGPCYVRLGRKSVEKVYEDGESFEVGKAKVHGEGSRAAIFATGVMVQEALKAQEKLKEENIDVRVVDIFSIKPIDEEAIVKCANECDILISCEEHSIIGGLGGAISEVLSEKAPKKLYRMGIKDEFGRSGKADELMKYYKLTSENIYNLVKSI